MLPKKYSRSMTDQIDPGQLDERMQLHVCGAVDDTNIYGEDTRGVTVSDVRVMVSYGSGNEGLMDGRVSTTQKMSFVIRYRSDVTVDDHFVWQGTSYNIKSLVPIGRRRYLICNVELIDR